MRLQVKPPEISASSLRFGEELGEDRFGKVYEGHLYGGGEPAQPVTIKTLRERGEAALGQEFRREAALRSQLQHRNLVCLLGVVTRAPPLSMVFASSSLGDLHQFLLARSPSSDVGGSDDGKTSKSGVERADLLHIVAQVAAGMEYLSGKQLVHKDLAARNVLLFDKLAVKILDLGFSRNAYSADYYSPPGGGGGLPVRWMAPEALAYGSFSSDSDVWAYGVLLWEAFSYGLQPYRGRSNQEVVELVCSLQLLACPDDCPGRLYGLMLACWSQVPAARPPFRDIHARLRAGLEASSEGGASAASSTTQSSHVPPSPARHSPAFPYAGPHLLPLLHPLKAAAAPLYLPGYPSYPYLPTFYPLQVPPQPPPEAAAQPGAAPSVSEGPAEDGTSQEEPESPPTEAAPGPLPL